MNIAVIKRSGSEEPFVAEKIHKPLFWATAGIDGVSVSEIELKLSALLAGKTRITSEDLHESLIRATKDCITNESPNYDAVAGRLVTYQVRKTAYGEYESPHLSLILAAGIAANRYDPGILSYYSPEEWDQINDMIDHERDYLFRYAGAQQMRDKYLVKNRITGKIFESFQIPYILAGAVAFHKYPKETRLHWVKEFYDLASQHYISLPTPIMSGVRTKVRQYSSCVVMDTGDDLDGIANVNSAAMKYVAKRAGLGINVGKIRGLGSDINEGEIKHTGIIPFIKSLAATVKSCSKGGIRDGAVTFFIPVWHMEFPEVVSLRDNSLTEESTCFAADYCIQFNKYMYQRFLSKGNITLFSPGENETPGLYESFFDKDQSKFAELYEKYEADSSIRKRTYSAKEIFEKFANQRSSGGRIYGMNVDIVNQRSSFKTKIRQSNLCVAGDTLILTDKGQLPIEELVGTSVNIWNGQEWSEVTPYKTGENQELINISFSDGSDISCTQYHKFYIQRGYDRGTGPNKLEILEVRAGELEEGDKLIKFDLPEAIESYTEDFPYAYTHGFFCGDGTYGTGNKPRISLYGEKKKLVNSLDKRLEVRPEDSQGRLNVSLPLDISSKFIVPTNYSISSKLNWLEGLMDSDGTVANNGTNQSLQCTSIHKQFLMDVRLMLQTLGINSKVCFNVESGQSLLPDGKGGSKYFDTQATWRLLISSSALYKLMNLGFNPKRLVIDKREPQHNAEQFVRVLSINSTSPGDTYCFTEPKRHMGIFNGIIAGNCLEITLPTDHLKHIDSGLEDNAEISLCTLAAVNWGKVKKPEDFKRSAEVVVRFLDELIDYQDYPLKAAEESTKQRRPLGIGIIGFAHFLAQRGMYYHQSSMSLVDEYAEAWAYYLTRASVDLAKEKGACTLNGETLYSEGWTPNLTRPEFLDQLMPHKERMPWAELRGDLKKYGIRNSTLMALMPSETSSQLANETNGFEPPRSPVAYKGSNGELPIVVPDLDELRNAYDWVWEQKTPKGYLEVAAVFQKYVDQAISINTSYDPTNFPGGEIGTKQVLGDMLYAYKLGHKTVYYQNTRKPGQDDIDNMVDACASGACKI